MENYYILNRETGKLELHFERSVYAALTEQQKREVKSSFLWGRKSACWISRCKWPNLHFAEHVAASLGLENAGETGERLSFAEQQERKAERAEHRAERFETISDRAQDRAEQLQSPLREASKDWAFVTQPNVNSSAGRAFTSRRNRMITSFERGFEEYKKSAYYQERAEAARKTASQNHLTDRAFIARRIAECEANIRGKKRTLDALESAENPSETSINNMLDRLEADLDKLNYYLAALEALGGIPFSRSNVKPGDVVKIDRYGSGLWTVVSCGPKNVTVRNKNFPYTLKYPYAEIVEKVEQTVSPEESAQLVKGGASHV